MLAIPSQKIPPRALDVNYGPALRLLMSRLGATEDVEKDIQSFLQLRSVVITAVSSGNFSYIFFLLFFLDPHLPFHNK